MNVGMMMVFASYGWDDCSDARVWDEEIRLARADDRRRLQASWRWKPCSQANLSRGPNWPRDRGRDFGTLDEKYATVRRCLSDWRHGGRQEAED
jgi:hypothetical protein